MFHPKKQPHAPPNVRLPKLPGIPSFDDIHHVLTQAQQNRGRGVELSWSNTNRSRYYMLTAKCEHSGGGEPSWLLHSGPASADKLVWTYVSGDVSLIFNLVMSECTGGDAGQEAQTDSYMTMPVSKGSSMSGEYRSPSTSGYYGGIGLGADADVLRSKARAILEGDLKNMQMPTLLQSIAMGKMTGRLEVQSPHGPADVFFEDGTPLHGEAREGKGDLAIMELLTWEEGEFHFYPGEKTTQRTINKRLDSLLMEGVTLLDQVKYLSTSGLKPESYLLRKHKSLSEADFERLVSKGAPLDLNVQKQFYQAIDNKSTLMDILRRRPLNKTEWTPVMFNLMTCDLLTISDQPPHVTRALSAPLQALGIDMAAIQGVAKSLQRSETGIFTYPAFLYFLEQEYFRFLSSGWPFSVAMFELRLRRGGPEAPLDPLPLTAVREATKRINSVKRNLDLFAHYETFDYAMMLPNTNSAAAGIFANRIVEVLLSAPLAEGVSMHNLALHLGIANIPEDCQELGLVLAAAREARNRAKQTNVPVVLYRDVRGR